MNTKDAIRSSINISSMVLKTYISDMSDADLMHRPTPDSNHLAWQLGHLISSEQNLLKMVNPEFAGVLPEGFVEAHSSDAATSDDAAKFHTKAEYEQLFDQIRAASLSELEAFPEDNFDHPSPENMRSFCPTLGDVFVLIATHPLMHAGQFAVARRQQGKPVLI